LLGIDPTDANILYVGTKGFEFPHALLKSTNGGASWHYASGPYPFDVMVIDPLNPNTLYAGSKLETDVLASTDGANSWHATGLKSTGVSMLAIDSKNPTTIYAGTVTSSYYDGLRFQGLFKSTDRGEVGGLSMTVCLI
jgi:hypothetical protein